MGLMLLILAVPVGVLMGWLLGASSERKINFTVGIIGAAIGSFATTLVQPVSEFGFFAGLVSPLFCSATLLIIVRLFSDNRKLAKHRNISGPMKDSAASQSDLTIADQVLEQHTQQPINLIDDHDINEQNLVIGIEEVPLDNRYGSSVLVSEHEFSKKARRAVKFERNSALEASLKGNILSIIEAEACGKIAENIGIDLQQEEFRRVTLRFEAAPGKMVLYRVIWKQTQRTGKAQIQLAKGTVRLPYVAVYGLSHSIESISLEG